jgi:hypothetical protein
MSNGPFDRILLNTREKVLSPDWNAEFSQQDRSILDTLAQLSTRRASVGNSTGVATDGFVGDGFSVHAVSPASMTVSVSEGLAFVANPYAVSARTNIGGVSGVNALSELVPVYLSSAQAFTVPTAPSAGQARIDLIEVRADHLVGGATSRQVLDPVTGAFVAASVPKLLSWDVLGRVGYVAPAGASTEPLSYREGTAAAAGSETYPTPTAGYRALAYIRVAATVTTIEENKILDVRRMYAPYGQLQISGRCRVYVSGGNWVIDNATISAPPGIDAAFAFLANPLTPTVLEDLFLVIRAGSITATEVAGAKVDSHQNPGAVSRMFSAQIVNITTYSIDSTSQGYLASSATATPQVNMAIGQSVQLIQIAAGMLEQSGSTQVVINTSAAATNVPTVANAAFISINVDLLRIA